MATIPVGELTPKLYSLLDQWKNDFEPLATAVNFIRGEMAFRIFGSGTSKKGNTQSGKNAAGQDLPTVAYSKKPLYVDPKRILGTTSGFRKGKTGKAIKSAYFPQGYAQLKQVLDRPPLELNNTLDIAFTKEAIIETQGANANLSIETSEAGKVAGLQKRYGEIFDLTKEEEKLFGEELTILVVEAINKKLNS
jgi:hypothetical protein